MFVNALNHYSKLDSFYIDKEQFNQLVDDFKSFAMNFPADEGLIL